MPASWYWRATPPMPEASRETGRRCSRIDRVRCGPMIIPTSSESCCARNLAGRAGAELLKHDPRRRVVAGAFLAAHLAIDAGLEQARRNRRAQQQVIEPQSGVARPALALVVPEREHRFRRMHRPDRVSPALVHQRLERSAALRLDQRILVPGLRRIDI